MTPFRIVTIGLGGYAYDHIRAVRWLQDEGIARLTGVVAIPADRDRYPERVQALQLAGVKLFDDIEQFLASGASQADVLMSAVGIHEHVPVAIAALRQGLHVYSEKPAAATIQDVDRLIEESRQQQRLVQIGFQYIATPVIQRLQALLCSGALGRVRAARLICGWPRSERYFSRNAWAGKIKIGEQWVLDSPANNAHAHYLFNMLYLCAPRRYAVARPVHLQAALYRANRIQSTDLVQIRFTTDTGADCFVVLAHCGQQRVGPELEVMAEHGTIRWYGDFGDALVIQEGRQPMSFNGSRKHNWRYGIVRDFICSILAKRRPLCPPELARAQTLTINAMHESCPIIHPIEEREIIEELGLEDYPPQGEERFRRVRNLDALMWQAYATCKFFSELGIPWAGSPGKALELNDSYNYFPQFCRTIH